MKFNHLYQNKSFKDICYSFMDVVILIHLKISTEIISGMENKLIKEEQILFDEISQIIESSKRKVLIAVNTELVLLYWNIGSKLNNYVLGNQRAGYGKEVVKKLSISLTEAFGKGWDDKTLRHCLRCAEIFTETQIVSALRRQLSWTHIKTIACIKDEVQRDFYLTMASNERWSSRQLQERINSMLYERTAISKKPEIVIKNDLEWNYISGGWLNMNNSLMNFLQLD